MIKTNDIRRVVRLVEYNTKEPKHSVLDELRFVRHSYYKNEDRLMAIRVILTRAGFLTDQYGELSELVTTRNLELI